MDTHRRRPGAPPGTAPEIVAIDGKTSRRTHDRGKDRGPLHLVSAWASSQRLVLGQQACEAKSNEITAIPLLLERLALTGALVTPARSSPRRARHHRCHGNADQDRAEAEVERNGSTSLERRYYISSLPLDAKLLAHAVRCHWHVENRLHWVLDVVFHEDLSRLRSGAGPQNMATVRHIAMNLLRVRRTCRMSTCKHRPLNGGADRNAMSQANLVLCRIAPSTGARVETAPRRR